MPMETGQEHKKIIWPHEEMLCELQNVDEYRGTKINSPYKDICVQVTNWSGREKDTKIVPI